MQAMRQWPPRVCMKITSIVLFLRTQVSTPLFPDLVGSGCEVSETRHGGAEGGCEAGCTWSRPMVERWEWGKAWAASSSLCYAVRSVLYVGVGNAKLAVQEHDTVMSLVVGELSAAWCRCRKRYMQRCLLYPEAQGTAVFLR